MIKKIATHNHTIVIERFNKRSGNGSSETLDDDHSLKNQ